MLHAAAPGRTVALLLIGCLLAALAAGCRPDPATSGADATVDDGGKADGGEADGRTPPSSAIVYDGPVKFDEPAGISYAGGMLYVADTNNHEIRTIDLNDDYRTGTFVIEGLKPPSVPPEPRGMPAAPTPVNERESAAVADADVGEAPDDPRAATPRPPAPSDPRTAAPHPPMPVDEEALSPLEMAFPHRKQLAWQELHAELPQDPELWVNTDRPLKISDFKGKFVLLDFWTFCCINCIHILPEIKKLERAYPNQLAVIGVHSAKFAGEKVTQNIADAVLRYEIEHPVVNDKESDVWNTLGIDAWPTVVIIDPEGYVVGVQRSEWEFEDLNRFFTFALPLYREEGLLNERPMKLPLLRDKQNPRPLSYPGKVLADEKGNRLFIADSNNNRIVVCSLQGELIDVIGTGAIGRDDGGYDKATFNKPQGMALRGETLYVADTENHLIRKIDLKDKKVAAVAGTGEQGGFGWPGLERALGFGDLPERYVGEPSEVAINSPWALYVHDDVLYIAMAGTHQIWTMKLDETEIGPYAGDGREDIVDGALLPQIPPVLTGRKSPDDSSFAQPSGLTSDGQRLYVADSEGSSIRAVPLDGGQPVETLVGTSQLTRARLFTFGNRDGKGLLRRLDTDFIFEARPDQTTGPLMQHCLGVVHHGGKLYVADTYNNAIKQIDLKTRACVTIAGEKPREDAEATDGSGSEAAGEP